MRASQASSIVRLVTCPEESFSLLYRQPWLLSRWVCFLAEPNLLIPSPKDVVALTLVFRIRKGMLILCLP